jgi:hypothetical protein
LVWQPKRYWDPIQEQAFKGEATPIATWRTSCRRKTIAISAWPTAEN